MEKIVANLSSKVVKKTLQGRDYLVAPVAMLVEGVFSGSQGPIFYEGPEMAKNTAVWNAKPITVGHPELPDGTKVSGCTADTLETYQVGMILNTRFNKKTKKLTAEAWIDTLRLATVPQGHLIANALANETKLEVSTGLFVDNQDTTGEYNGTAYSKKATNFQPDHLAILLTEKGACSLADGAGLLVNKGEKTLSDCYPILVSNAKKDASLMKKVEAVRAAVYKKHEKMGSPTSPSVYVYIEDILEKSVIFSMGDKVYRQNYAIENDSVTLLGTLIPVTRKVTYEPLVANQNEKAKMDRTKLASLLGDDHKEFVANLSDEQVVALAKLQVEPAPAPEAPKAPVANTLTEIVDAAPAHLQSQLKDALVANQRLRDGYVTVIVANKANKFSSEDLGAMSTSVLENLAALATVVAPAPVTNAQTKDPIYAGSPVTNSAPVVETPFSAPSTL